MNVIESLGDGKFAAPRPVADSATAMGDGKLEVADVDLDGLPDIVVGFEDASRLGTGGLGWFRQLTGTSETTFESMEVIGLHVRGLGPSNVVTADFDGDTGPDFLMTDVRHSLNGRNDNDGYGLRWYSSTASNSSDGWQNPSMPLDVNGDELVTPTDAIQVINELNGDNGSTRLKTSANEARLGVSTTSLIEADDEEARDEWFAELWTDLLSEV